MPACTASSVNLSIVCPLMRIVSLVPSATEMLFALGLGDEVVAVTHECDFPPEAADLPRITRDVIGPGLGPDEIDAAVRALTSEGRAIYELDEPALRELAPGPDRHPGAVRRLRGVRRRRASGGGDARTRAEGGLARPDDARRGARRRPHARTGDRPPRRRRGPRPGRRRADRRGPAGRPRRRAPARRRARVARSRLRRGPLDAADDRLRRRRGRARACRASTPRW